MVTKDIMTQSLNGLTSSFKGTANVKVTSTTGDFSKTMSDVQENQANQAKSATTAKSKTDVSSGMKKLKNSNKPELDNGERLEIKPEVKEAMKAAEAVNKMEGESVESENAVVLMSGQILTPELLNQGMEQLEEKITELVTEVLDITDKELMDLLEESGMKLMDLLNPDNLKQFVLDVNGQEDAISLITNEDLASQFNQLLEGMENLKLEDSLGITKEELINVLETAKEQPDMADTALSKGNSEQVNSEENGEAATEDAVKIVVEKDNQSQSMDNSSKEETFQNDSRLNNDNEIPQDTKPVDLFVQNLTAQSTGAAREINAEQLQTMKEIVNQIVEQIKISIKPESTSMEIQLNPESLGRVDLTVVSKNGLLTASFTAENQIAKEAIESQMQVLKDNLNNQGVKVEAIEVNVAEFGFRQNTESGADAQGQSRNQKKSGNRRINLDYFDEEGTDASEEEVLAARVLRDNGGTVDYTA